MDLPEFQTSQNCQLMLHEYGMAKKYRKGVGGKCKLIFNWASVEFFMFMEYVAIQSWLNLSFVNL